MTVLRDFAEALKGVEKWPALMILMTVVMFLIFGLQSAGVINAAEFGLFPPLALTKPWTLLTSIFIHAGAEHLFFNAWFFMILGYHVEVGVGKRGLLAAFFLAGFVGSLGSIFIYPTNLVVGASGAIMGLAGFLAAVDPFRPVRILFGYWTAAGLAAIYGLLDFFFMFASEEPIGYGAHILGLIAGAALGLAWKRWGEVESI